MKNINILLVILLEHMQLIWHNGTLTIVSLLQTTRTRTKATEEKNTKKEKQIKEVVEVKRSEFEFNPKTHKSKIWEHLETVCSSFSMAFPFFHIIFRFHLFHVTERSHSEVNRWKYVLQIDFVVEKISFVRSLILRFE